MEKRTLKSVQERKSKNVGGSKSVWEGVKVCGREKVCRKGERERKRACVREKVKV